MLAALLGLFRGLWPRVRWMRMGAREGHVHVSAGLGPAGRAGEQGLSLRTLGCCLQSQVGTHCRESGWGLEAA